VDDPQHNAPVSSDLCRLRAAIASVRVAAHYLGTTNSDLPTCPDELIAEAAVPTACLAGC
jgi:hypothetical protein